MGMIPRLGIRFSEHMGGRYSGIVPDIGGGRCHLHLNIRCTDFSRAVVDIVGELTGTIELENWVEGAPLEGTFRLSPVWKRRVAYEFDFTAPQNGGERMLRYRGRKQISPRNLLRSWTTLMGRVADAETSQPLANVRLRFDLKADLAPWLASFRMLLQP